MMGCDVEAGEVPRIPKTSPTHFWTKPREGVLTNCYCNGHLSENWVAGATPTGGNIAVCVLHTWEAPKRRPLRIPGQMPWQSLQPFGRLRCLPSPSKSGSPRSGPWRWTGFEASGAQQQGWKSSSSCLSKGWTCGSGIIRFIPRISFEYPWPTTT